MFTQRKQLILLLAIFALAVLPFLGNINDGFLSDDWDFLSISANRVKPLWTFFGTNYYGTHDGGVYRPMVNVFWAMSYKLFHLQPFGYHFFTLVFHGLNAVLLFLLLRSLPWVGEKAKALLAWAAVGFFIVFPNHAEAVNWISVVNDTLMTLFYLLTLWLFLQSVVVEDKRKRNWFYVASLVTFFLSLLTKEMALTLPIVLGIFTLYHLLKNKAALRSYVTALYVLSPFAGITIFYFFLRYFATGFFLKTYTGDITLTSFQIWRANLSIFVSHFFGDGLRTDITMYLYFHRIAFLLTSLCILIVLFFLCLRKRYSLFPFVVFGTFFISIIPVLQYAVNITPQYFSEEGERYAYLPSVFMAIFLGYLMMALLQKVRQKAVAKQVVLLVVGVLWIGLCFQLAQKNTRWHEAAALSDKTLASTAVSWDKEKYDGVVFVGLPDSYHGVYLFRNGFAQALHLTMGNKIEPKQILITANRTVYSPSDAFLVERKDSQTFHYASKFASPHIVSELKIKTHDYSSELLLHHIEPYTLSQVFFGTALDFHLSPEFLRDNTGKHIGVWFFSDGEWIQESLRQL